MPSATAVPCAQRGASAQDLATTVADVVNIVHESLFSALDLGLSTRSCGKLLL